MRDTIPSLLVRHGARDIRIFDDPQEAISALGRLAADFIICDWEMEPISGLDFVRRVRSAGHEGNPFVPIILLTADDDSYRVMPARDAGVTGFLAKSVVGKVLHATIISAIENPTEFIRTDGYFGPDRRQRGDPFYRGPELRRRREDDDDDVGAAERHSGPGSRQTRH